MISKEELQSISETYKNEEKRALKKLEQSLICSAENGEEAGGVWDITNYSIVERIKTVLEENNFNYTIDEYSKLMNRLDEKATKCYKITVYWY